MKVKMMDKDAVISRLIPVYLLLPHEYLETVTKSTASEIRDNHYQILDFLKCIGVEDEHLNRLKEELRLT